MNLCLFFEGTGQGVAGKRTNVTRLRDICVDDTRQKLHLVRRGTDPCDTGTPSKLGRTIS